MKIITQQEIKDFVLAQPDDRKVDMRENLARSECGCIMVHYARENNIDHESCGGIGFNDNYGASNAMLKIPIVHHFNNLNYSFVGTYGELKKMLK